MFVSQAGSWSVSGPWRPWVWPRPWCSSHTWPCPATIRPWPPCLAYQASTRCSYPNRSWISWRTSSRRSCTPVMTTRSPTFPIFCSTASTGCARSSCCGSSSGPSLCQVTAQGHSICYHGDPLADLTEGLSLNTDRDRGFRVGVVSKIYDSILMQIWNADLTQDLIPFLRIP